MKTPLLLIVLGALATGCVRGPVTKPATSDRHVGTPSQVASLPPGAMEFTYEDERERTERAPAAPSTRLRIDDAPKPRHLLVPR